MRSRRGRVAWIVPLFVASVGSFAAAQTVKTAQTSAQTVTTAPPLQTVAPPPLAGPSAAVWASASPKQRAKLTEAARALAAELSGKPADPKATGAAARRLHTTMNLDMPIEDAVMLMFSIIADDARKDMKQLLEEMEATRKKRAALRADMQQLRESLQKKEEILKLMIDARRESVDAMMKMLEQAAAQRRPDGGMASITNVK